MNLVNLKHEIRIIEEYTYEKDKLHYLIQSMDNRLNHLIKQLEQDKSIIILNIYNDESHNYYDDWRTHKTIRLERVVEYIDKDEVEESEYKLITIEDEYYLVDKDSVVIDLKDYKEEF